MKKLFLTAIIVASTSFALISCSSEEDSNQPSETQGVNLTDAQAIQRHILNGYWQYESTIDLDDNQVEEAEHYFAYKFKANNTHDYYYQKNVKHSERKYKIDTIDGKAVYILYSTESDFEDNIIHDYNTFNISIENDKIKLESREGNYIDYFKFYETMGETKDLPVGGL